MNANSIPLVNAWSAAWASSIGRACWQGGLFILIVWAACRWIKMLPTTVRHGLWLVACMKLILGIVAIPTIDLSLLPARRELQSQPAATVKFAGNGNTNLRKANVRADGTSQVNSLKPGAPGPPDMNEPGVEVARVSLISTLWIVWLLGFTACLGIFARQVVTLRRLLRNARSLTNTQVGQEARLLGVSFGLSRPPRIVESPEVTAPMVTGAIRPTIVVPVGFAKALTPMELHMALAHEMAHVRRFDLWLAIVPTITQWIFFFFPPAWLACREWATAREAACDESALRVTGAVPPQYAAMLLKIVAYDSRGGFVPALGATAGYHTVQSRLASIRQFALGGAGRLRPATAAIGVLALLAVLPWRVVAQQAGHYTLPHTGPVSYILTDLGTLPHGVKTAARSINNRGEVAGDARTKERVIRAFIWRPGTGMTDLGEVDGSHWSQATGINDQGEVVGTSSPDMEAYKYRACVWEPDGTYHYLISPGAHYSAANCINESGVIGGRYAVAPHTNAFVYQPGVGMLQDASLPKDGWVNSIDSAGRVVGNVQDREERHHAFYWTWTIGMVALPEIGGPSSEANGVSDTGTIVGDAENKNREDHAVIWQVSLRNGKAEITDMRDLGTLGGPESHALGVNRQGQVVGNAEIEKGVDRAFIWDSRFAMRNLNDLIPRNSGWVLLEARAINDHGQIAARGWFEKQERSCVLTPIR